jgi:hypothetical protein
VRTPSLSRMTFSLTQWAICHIRNQCGARSVLQSCVAPCPRLLPHSRWSLFVLCGQREGRHGYEMGHCRAPCQTSLLDPAIIPAIREQT